MYASVVMRRSFGAYSLKGLNRITLRFVLPLARQERFVETPCRSSVFQTDRPMATIEKPEISIALCGAAGTDLAQTCSLFAPGRTGHPSKPVYR